MATVLPVIELKDVTGNVNTDIKPVTSTEIKSGNTFLEVYQAAVKLEDSPGLEVKFTDAFGVAYSISREGGNVNAVINATSDVSTVIDNLIVSSNTAGNVSIEVSANRGPYIQYPKDIDTSNLDAAFSVGMAYQGSNVYACNNKGGLSLPDNERIVVYDNNNYENGFQNYGEGPGSAAADVNTLTGCNGLSSNQIVVMGQKVGGTTSCWVLGTDGTWVDQSASTVFGSAAYSEVQLLSNDGTYLVCKQTSPAGNAPAKLTVNSSSVVALAAMGNTYANNGGTVFTAGSVTYGSAFTDGTLVSVYRPGTNISTILVTQPDSTNIPLTQFTTASANTVAACGNGTSTNFQVWASSTQTNETYEIRETASQGVYEQIPLNRPAINTAELGFSLSLGSYPVFVRSMRFNSAENAIYCMGFLKIEPEQPTNENIVPAVQIYRLSTSSWESLVGSPKTFSLRGYVLGQVNSYLRVPIEGTTGSLLWFGGDTKALGVYQNTATEVKQQSVIVIRDPNPKPTDSSSNSTLSTGAIAGIAVGAVVLVAIIIVVVIVYQRRKKKKRE